MDPIEKVLATAEQNGILLWLDHDELRFRSPKAMQATPLFTEIKARKDEIVAFLTSASVGREQQAELRRQLAESGPELSLQQHWLLLTKDKVCPYAGRYNQVAILRARGEFDLEVWNHALTQLLIDHEILRTTYTDTESDGLVGSVQAPSAVAAQVMDCFLSEDDTDDTGTQFGDVLALASRVAREDIDLSRTPLLRAHVFNLGVKDHLLAVTMNHFVSDGFSIAIMVKDLIRNYMAGIHRTPAKDGRARRQHSDYVQWQAESIAKGTWSEGQAYWVNQYTATDHCTIPAQYARSDTEPRGAVESMFSVSPENLQLLRALAKKEYIGYELLLISIFQAALFIWTTQEKFLITLVYHGRHQPELLDQIGLYMLTQLYPADCSGDPSLRMLLKSASICWPLLVRDGGIPAKLAAVETGRRDTPRVFFNVLADFGKTVNPVSSNEHGAPLNFSFQRLPLNMNSPPPLDLSVFVVEQDERLNGLLWFRADLISSEAAVTLRHAFDRVIAAMLSNPDALLSEL